MTVSTTVTIEADSPSVSDNAMAHAGRLDTILVKTASRCNIDCSYCYVYQGPDSSWRLQPKRMHREGSRGALRPVDRTGSNGRRWASQSFSMEGNRC